MKIILPYSILKKKSTKTQSPGFSGVTKGAAETKHIAALLAKTIQQESYARRAWVIALSGSLGSGKTTFVQGFAQGLGIKQKVLSPTFLIIKHFSIPQEKNKSTSKFYTFYHIDCYRITRAKELLRLGWREIITNPKNIVTVEWAERVKNLIPEDAVWVDFKYAESNQRRIQINTFIAS